MFDFVRKHLIFLLFGFMAALFSSPGQTFFVSLFIPGMQQAFDMTRTEISSLYGLITLISALILPWMGRLLDRCSLFAFTWITGLGLAVGCALMGAVSYFPIFCIGFFLVRNLGQGTLTMLSSTTMARHFGSLRGKALGFSGLGYPFGEMLFPLAIAPIILNQGWRIGWLTVAIVILLFYLPTVLFCLKKSHHFTLSYSREGGEGSHSQVSDWTLEEVMQDPRFYLLIFAILIPPTLYTGLFFHHVDFFEWKLWSFDLIAKGFVAFGACRAVASFLIGPLIDRYSAKSLFPFNFCPLFLGLLCFLFFDHSNIVYVYLGLAGTSMGLSMTLSGALFAEFYGVRELGAIRGLKSSALVCMTAMAPPALGFLLDRGIGFTNLLYGMIVLVFGSFLLSFLACYGMKTAEK